MKRKGIILVMALSLLMGCGKKESGAQSGAAEYRNDVSPQAVAEAVAADLGENYWANMEIPAEYLNDIYGVSADMYEEAYAQMPMISANVDTLIIVKANEANVEDVQNALNTYREAMVQDTFQYPVNIPKIQASQVETFGNYVCFVQLGADMGGEMDDEEVMIKACQEMNGQALAVIEGELKK
ncbi:MAG: DUF4358 domain-containing protein [Lachnospiraceae bacterium]|nr:DUF4358 domain-containing protein [Lachnospiraceae bacterium]